MRRPPPIATAAAVMLAATTAWVGLQALLASAHGRESAAAEALMFERFPATTFAGTDTGASYWGGLVLTGAVQMLALSVLALVFVWAGRRWVWALLGLPLLVNPTVGEAPISWVRPIGFGWTGPWVQAATGIREPAPSINSIFGLLAVGTAVDLLVIALPALVFLLLTWRSERHAVLSWLEVARRLALPVGLIAAASVGYGLVNLNGGDSERTIPVVIVPLAAGLLATTRFGTVIASALVAVGGVIASPAAGYLAAPGLHDSYSPEAWTAIGGYALPLAALAVIGAVVGAHGTAIAAVYRHLVRRPHRPVAEAHA